MKRSRTENLSENTVKTLHTQGQLTYVELYAGVGGWTMALEQAIQTVDPSVSLVCAAALDHSDLCMSVYEHNHQPPQEHVETERGDQGKRRARRKKQPTVRLQDLTAEQVIAWKADILMMSPPCQPHSRQHSNQEKDLQDPRSQSFLHVCSLLKDLPEESLPQLILLENVVGFESSNSCWRWRTTLAERGYHVGHFHLTPTQVGIPNDRPRYFCVAVRESSATVCRNLSLSTLESYLELEKLKPTDKETAVDPGSLHVALEDLQVQSLEDLDAKSLPKLKDFIDPTHIRDGDSRSDLRIPHKVLQSSAAWCMDIVTPCHRRTACFTSGYGMFVRGTGSVLYKDVDDSHAKDFALVAPENREFDANWADGLDLMKLRYFSGMEMAQLFGFSSHFSFPQEIASKQQWKLVGNSLNVRVASRLIELGLRVLWKMPASSG